MSSALGSLYSNITEICYADRRFGPARFVVGVLGDIWDVKSSLGRVFGKAYRVSDFFRRKLGDLRGLAKTSFSEVCVIHITILLGLF